MKGLAMGLILIFVNQNHTMHLQSKGSQYIKILFIAVIIWD